MIAIKIGDTFGQWKVIGEPSLSSKGKITLTDSRCACVCTGCSTESEVQVRNLVQGKSKACLSCAAVERHRRQKEMGEKHYTGTRKPNPENPLCPKCLTLMNVNCTYRKADGINRYYTCRKCGEVATRFFPYVEADKNV